VSDTVAGQVVGADDSSRATGVADGHDGAIDGHGELLHKHHKKSISKPDRDGVAALDGVGKQYLSVDGGHVLGGGELVGVDDSGSDVEVEHRLEIREAGGGGGEVVVHQGLGGLERLEGVVVGGEGGDARRVGVVERDVGQSKDSRQSLENVDLDEWRCGKGEKMKIRPRGKAKLLLIKSSEEGDKAPKW
jgi:hypothetical protein